MGLNRTVPLIMSVGNHDVGFDALSKASISKDFSKIPLFFMFNPQHGTNQSNSEGIPRYDQRSTIHHHLIGNTMHVILDSGYLKKY